MTEKERELAEGVNGGRSNHTMGQESLVLYIIINTLCLPHALTYDGERNRVRLPAGGHVGGEAAVPAAVRPPHRRQAEVISAAAISAPGTRNIQRLAVFDPAATVIRLV